MIYYFTTVGCAPPWSLSGWLAGSLSLSFSGARATFINHRSPPLALSSRANSNRRRRTRRESERGGGRKQNKILIETISYNSIISDPRIARIADRVPVPAVRAYKSIIFDCRSRTAAAAKRRIVHGRRRPVRPPGAVGRGKRPRKTNGPSALRA